MNIFSKQNVFSKQIHEKIKSRCKLEDEMKKFSKELQSTMKISDEVIELANSENHEWVIPDYIISARSFCHTSGWETLLLARPANTNDPGWSNVEFKCNDDDWIYSKGGTKTFFFPKKHMQERIKMSIRSVLAGSN